MAASDYSDPIRTAAEGGSYIGRGAVPHHQKLFSCGFLWHTLLNRCRPDLGTLKTMCHRLRKRWDENTPSGKRPHRGRLLCFRGRCAPTSSTCASSADGGVRVCWLRGLDAPYRNRRPMHTSSRSRVRVGGAPGVGGAQAITPA